MTDLEKFLIKARSRGQMSFCIDDLYKHFDKSEMALKKSLKRLEQKGRIVFPIQGFFVLIPDQNIDLKSLPPEQLIPLWMEYWRVDYYVCLLSAGLYNGASHQKPNRFQVMIAKNVHKDFHMVGNVAIEFIYKKSIKGLPLKEKEVESGRLKIATPELLAMDLFLYPRKCGGLNHIATVLSELIEEIDLEKFKKFATESEHTFWMQRMGYILDSIDPMEEEKKEDIMKILEDVLKTRKTYFTPIEPVVKHKGANRNKKWKIIENATVESDV